MLITTLKRNNSEAICKLYILQKSHVLPKKDKISGMKIKILMTQIERKINLLKKWIDPSVMNYMIPHTTVKHHVGLINVTVG